MIHHKMYIFCSPSILGTYKLDALQNCIM